MDAALFVPDGGRWMPTALTVGPWSPDALHGGPVAALVTRAVEEAPAPGPMDLVRVTLELLRPVPLRPLVVEAEVTRPGRNVQLVEVRVEADGVEVARARALRIRRAPVAVPEPVAEEVPAAPDPDAAPPAHAARTAFLGAVDLRFVRGTWDEVGPVTLWGRLVVPVVPDESPSPRQQAAAIADFGNGVSRLVDFETHRFLNPDLTVSFSRTPGGSWIGLDAVSRLSGEGWGSAESRMFDSGGTVGRALQHLLLVERDPTAG